MRYGHIPDTHDARDHVFVGAISNGPSVTDLRDTDAEIWNQGDVGSCVAQSLCGAVANRAERLGIVLPKPSAMALYGMARLPDTVRGPDGKPMLPDDGCRPRVAAQSMRKLGLVPEERWPYIESRKTWIPPWDIYQHGADALVAGFSRIASMGQQRIDQIRHALASGYPVPFAQVVDQAFEDYAGTSAKPLRAFSGDPLGGHMTVIVGVDDSRGVFIARNSWGTTWGLSGYYEMLFERVVHPTTSDFYVVTLKGDAPHES